MSNYKCELCTKGCGAKEISGVFCIPVKIKENNEENTTESLGKASRCQKS
jgi:hypothetical protein